MGQTPTFKYASLGEAIAIASVAHSEQTTRDGGPYILHPLFVMQSVAHLCIHTQVAAVLHDVLEDHPQWSIDVLRRRGFHPKVLKALALLNHDPKVPYEEYIEGIGEDEIATNVKMADLDHNSRLTRLKGVSKKDLARTIKYNKAYTYLRGNKDIYSR